jgi:hypothetical protein
MVDWIPARSLGLTAGKSNGSPPPPPSSATIPTLVSHHSRTTSPRPNSFGTTWLVILLVVVIAAIGASWYAHSVESQNRSSKSMAKSYRRKTLDDHSPLAQRNKATQTRIPISITSPERNALAAEIESEDSLNLAEREPPEKSEPKLPRIIVGGKSTESKKEASSDERPRSTTKDGTIKALTLYQDIDVQREPTISVEGMSMNQSLHYRIISRLLIEPQGNAGEQSVQQEVVATDLQAADEMSRAEYEKSLRELKGLVLTFHVGDDGRITSFKGHKDSRAATKLDRSDSAGFLVTSLIDEDGWKELTRLTFFRPKQQPGAQGSWQDQMTHDWGPLGKWLGLTTFTPGRNSSESLREYEYVHAMEYEPPRTEVGSLPFQLKDADFEPLEAGGVIHYDPHLQQVTDVQERFHVRGTVNTEVLGQTAAVELEEHQVLTIRLMDQMPQMPR